MVVTVGLTSHVVAKRTSWTLRVKGRKLVYLPRVSCLSLKGKWCPKTLAVVNDDDSVLSGCKESGNLLISH